MRSKYNETIMEEYVNKKWNHGSKILYILFGKKKKKAIHVSLTLNRVVLY